MILKIGRFWTFFCISFWVGRPKMDFLKSTKGGTLWVGRGSNPQGGVRATIPPPREGVYPPPPKPTPNKMLSKKIFPNKMVLQ